jgi:hypothetical protein
MRVLSSLTIKDQTRGGLKNLFHWCSAPQVGTDRLRRCCLIDTIDFIAELIRCSCNSHTIQSLAVAMPCRRGAA